MIKINETLQVRSLFNCDDVGSYKTFYEYDPMWRQTYVGCMLLDILQEMFCFNISYQLVNYTHLPMAARTLSVYPHTNDSVDVYVKPMELQGDLLDNAYPIEEIFMWRLGFILRRKYNFVLTSFYTQPFNILVWSCVYTMTLFGAIIFYILSQWDTSLFGGECSFAYELLLAFSAYCQHILPLQATSYSRRIAYLTFIVCAYVVHSFYTSNLLSHLVSDNEKSMDLHSLAESDYRFALLKDMNMDTEKSTYEMSLDKNLSIVWKKMLQCKIMDLPSALKAVIGSKTALLTEYFTLYPLLKQYLDSEVLCQLVEIDLYSKVKQYFFTSKTFLYKEEFKIGTMWAKETGLVKHILGLEKYSRIKCVQSLSIHEAQIEHVIGPILILLSAYMLTLIILVGEIIHYRMNRVWPYIE